MVFHYSFDFVASMQSHLLIGLFLTILFCSIAVLETASARVGYGVIRRDGIPNGPKLSPDVNHYRRPEGKRRGGERAVKPASKKDKPQ